MLSYHWDSHAIACLISLLHGKCQSASVDTSAISLIMNYLGDNSALFAGLSLKSIIQIDHPEKKKSLLYLGTISCISVCVHCHMSWPPARSICFHPFPSLPLSQILQIDQIPQSLPFFGLYNSHGPGHCLSAGTKLAAHR